MLGPLAILAVQATGRLFASPRELAVLAVPWGRRLGLLLRGLGLAAGVSASALVLGVPAAIFLSSRAARSRRAARWLLLSMFVVPPYIHALAWLAAVRPANALLGLAGLAPLPSYGWPACWWAETMAFAPVVLGLALLGMERVDPGLVEAARLSGPDARVLGRVILPLARPYILAGGAFVFLLSLAESGVPMLFHVNIYPFEILAEFSASAEPVRALFLSAPLLILAAIVLTLSLRPLRLAALSGGAGGPWRGRAPAYPVGLAICATAAVGCLMTHLGALFAALFVRTGGPAAFVSGLRLSGEEILLTLWTSAAAAAAAACLAVLTAGRLVGKAPRNGFLWIAVAAALAVPAPLTGTGLAALAGAPAFAFLREGGAAVVLVSIARFAPFAVLILAAHLRRVDRTLLEAARVFEKNLLRSRLRIDGRLAAPGVLAAAAIVFSLSAGETAATLVVAPPGRETLALKIFSYLHYGAVESVAGLCLFLAGTTLAFGLLCARVLRTRPPAPEGRME